MKINNQADFEKISAGDVVEYDCPVCGAPMQFVKFFSELPNGCDNCRTKPATDMLDVARKANGE